MKNHNSSTIHLLEEEGLLPSEEKELIEYGLQQLKVYLSSIIIALLFGFLFGIFPQSIIFLLAFIPLRMYAGGYHSDSPIRCYITSLFILLVSFYCIKYIPLHFTIYFILSSLSTSIICYLAPVENNTRKLEEIEIIVFKKRTRIIAVIIYFIAIISCFFNFNILVKPIITASIIVSISLIAGHIKYKKN